MTIYLPPGSKKYVYKFKMNGEWFHGPTGQTDKREAEKIEREAKKQARLEIDRRTNSQTPTGMTLLEAVSKYVAMKGEGMDRSDLDFVRLVDRMGADTLMSIIDTEMVREMVEKRRADPKLLPNTGQPLLKKNPWTGAMETVPLATSTINRTSWELFKRVYLRARDKWRVPVQPIDWKEFSRDKKKEKRRTRELKLEEEALIMEHLREGYGACFRFAVLAGLRLSNFTDLRWDQIDWGADEYTIIVKGGEVRTKKLCDQQRQILLAEWQRSDHHSTHVFSFISEETWFNPKNNKYYVQGQRYQVTYWGFTTWMKRLTAKLGIHGLTRHDLRRTAGGRMLRATGNLKGASQQLDHSDVKTTADFYAHVTPDDMIDLQNRTHAVMEQRRNKLRDQGMIRDPEPVHNDIQVSKSP